MSKKPINTKRQASRQKTGANITQFDTQRETRSILIDKLLKAYALRAKDVVTMRLANLIETHEHAGDFREW